MVGVGAFLIGTTACAGADTPSSRTSLEVVDTAAIREGDCIASLGQNDRGAAYFNAVPCDDPAEPWTAQIVLVSTFPDGPYPGDAAVQLTAKEMCDEASPPEHGWKNGTLTPGEGAWNEGDKSIVCWKFREGQPLQPE